MTASLLIAHHAPTRATRELLECLESGASHPEIESVAVRSVPALEVTVEDLLSADGYLLLTPANFGYMSGALKHMFDSTFLQIGGALDPDGGAGGEGKGASTRGRPYGMLVHGRYDTAGAVRAVESIVSALGWGEVGPALEIIGEVTEEHREGAQELGATVAATLMA